VGGGRGLVRSSVVTSEGPVMTEWAVEEEGEPSVKGRDGERPVGDWACVFGL
jgi:hypothetical protein